MIVNIGRTILGVIMKIKELGEFTFIDSINDNLIYDATSIEQGIGDDCAVYKASENTDQLITTDMMVEGIHFSEQTTSLYDVGYRLAAANISDIAAMGGIPKQLVLGLAIPKEYEVDGLYQFYAGMKALCRQEGVNVIGGDTVSTSGPLVVTATVIGEVEKGNAILRSGACAGDLVGVTNFLGSSKVGLDVLLEQREGYEFSKTVHQRPQPQVRLGRILQSLGATSMNDISDGLASELIEIATASKKDIIIDKEAIPLHEETYAYAKLKGVPSSDFALYGGEDFQLVFTIPADKKEQLEKYPELRLIGHVVEGTNTVWLLDANSSEASTRLAPQGYNHFTIDGSEKHGM